MEEVRRLDASQAGAIVSVFCDAFGDYPVMRHVLGGMPEATRLEKLIHLFVMARVLRGEPLFGIGPPDGVLIGAATVSYPGAGETPPEFHRLRTEIFAELGGGARERYEQYGDATGAFAIDEPHTHLNMIGVRGNVAGTGYGRRLLDRVHRLSEEDPGSAGVSLTTENPRNVALYEHFGYELVGHVRVTPELETWGFFRRDRT